MSFDLHDFLLRISDSLEVATVVGATTVVYLAVIRSALHRQLEVRPDLELEVRRAWQVRSLVVATMAGMLMALAFAFELRGQLFGRPSDGMRLSAAAFFFVVWAIVVTTLLRVRSQVRTPATRR